MQSLAHLVTCNTMQPKLCELPISEPRTRRVQGGVCTSDVTLSAHTGDNSDIFPKVLSLHVPKCAKVADVTYGLGVFWRNVDLDDYKLLATDLKTGTDCRNLSLSGRITRLRCARSALHGRAVLKIKRPPGRVRTAQCLQVGIFQRPGPCRA